MPAETTVSPPSILSPPAPTTTVPLRVSAPQPNERDYARWQAPPPRRSRRRIWRIGGGVTLLALLTAGFVWLSALFAPPRGVEFCLIGAGYEQNLSVPHNVYGWNSLCDLSTVVDRGKQQSFWARRFWRSRPEPARLTTDTNLGDLAPRGSALNWVLFISAHGACDADGAYLIADNDLTPSLPANRIPLARILEQLKSLPAEQHKVLVLDVVHQECDVSLGMIANDFVEELRKHDEQIAAIPNLVVISASDVDELSWPAPMCGRTTFSHFWVEGLRGAAADENDNGRITVAELMDFTSSQTSHWVAQYYHARQSPFLLPSGREGERRAHRMDLGWREGAYEPSTPTLSPPTAVPSELRDAWEQAHQLSLQPTPPYVYQPQRWRRYIATLARYEQLLLAGDSHAAERLGMDVQALARQCAHDPSQLLSSLDAQRSSSAFATPTTPQLRSRAQDVLQQLSRTPSEQWSDTWKKQLQLAGADAKPLRAEVMQLLVEQAIGDPPGRLQPVRRLAEIVRDPLQPLCPALHLVVMMDRDLPEEARTLEVGPLISHAIRVRQLAEQATTGDLIGFMQSSPRVRPWVKEPIEQADKLRQQGEDLLFADSSYYARAERYLSDAEVIYRQAIADGGIVLNAYRLRDQSLAILPDVSTSLLALPRTTAQQPELMALSQQVERAWGEAHTLSALLAAPTRTALRAGGSEQAPGSANLLDCSRRVQGELAALQAKLAALWAEQANSEATGEQLCLASLPSVAPLDVDARCQAWDRSLQFLRRRREDLSQSLLLAVNGYNYEQAAHAPVSSDLEMLQQTAAERGQLALAMLGKSQFEADKRSGEDTWAEALHRLQVFRVDANWREALRLFATQVELRWRRMPDYIRTTVTTDDSGPSTLDDCIAADSVGRILLPQFFTALDDDASEDLRRRRLSAYLAWQAERAWQDRWFAQHEDDTPYYAVRARALIADAERVSPQHGEFSELAARVRTNDQWSLELPARLAVTREESLRTSGRLVPMHQETLGGYVSLRITMGAGLKAMMPTTTAQAWPSDRATIDLPIRAEVSDVSQFGEHTQVATSVDVHAYYRGRRVNQQIAIELHSTPEFAIVEPVAPTGGMLALEVSPELANRFGRGQGAVVIVLDCSGSMGPRTGQAFDTQTRYAQATAALKTMLAGVPQGTQLSLWTFGQAVGSQKTVKDAEKTVRCLRPLSMWDPNDKKAFDALVQSFSYPASEPWNESAVVHAMHSAKDELAKAVGSKSLIVITDGIDNRFDHDQALNPKGLDVATGLTEAFRQSGIVVNFVGFQIASHEEQAARQQFAVIESFDPPGKFYSVDESAELLAALNASLNRRLRFWVEDYDRRTINGEGLGGWTPTAATTTMPRDRVTLNRGNYLLRVAAGQPLERSVIVGGGDLLLARLQSVHDQLAIERSSVLDRLYPAAQRATANDWSAAVVRSSLADDRGTVTVALERNDDANEIDLMHVAPRDVWWELQVAGADVASSALRVTRDYSVGLPSWRIDSVPQNNGPLPHATSGMLQGWWLQESDTVSQPQLVAGRDFRKVEDLIGRDLSIDGDCLTIVDARWEASDAGQQLVLVIDGAPHELVWARVRGVADLAAEHRHYESLSRYVGIFAWPASASTEVGYRIEFGSVGAMKRAAEARGTHVRFEKLLLQRSGAAASP